MALIYESKDYGYFLCHATFIRNMYVDFKNEHCTSIQYTTDLFSIINPYKQQKRDRKRKHENADHKEFANEVTKVEQSYSLMLKELKHNGIVCKCSLVDEKKIALGTAERVYSVCKRLNINNAHGENIEGSSVKIINESRFYFPKNCKFYCKDVALISNYFTEQQFDMILLDPPWWNKYIRRKKKKSDNAYQMMYNNDLKNIPLENILKNTGLVVVWCTNSLQNLTSLIHDIFPKWGVKYIGKWYWLKVTTSGDPICGFSDPPGKQPFEQIIFGARENANLKNFVDSKIVASVPSALHSHKPPLKEILQQFLPNNPSCLEIFARYLVSDWTSYGIEALLLQHESMFEVSQT